MADLSPNIDIGIGSSRAKKGAAAIRRALDSIRRKSKKVHRDGARDARKHGAALKRVAKFAAIAATALAARGIVKSQVAFTQAVADLSAITGATGEDLAFLSAKSKEFGETTTLSATQAAEAFKIIASAKPDLLENVEALSLVTEEAIALAEATGESLPTAANAMASALNQFGAGADQASRFINVLAAGSKRGAALVGEMAESLKSVGVIANIAGISFEETNAALQLMSTRAIKGSEAGMQFRGVLLALTSQSRDEFKPEVVGLQQALENLARAGLDEGSDAAQLFGRRNLAVANTLIKNRDKLAELTEQLTDTSIAYEQQAIRIDTLQGDTLALKSAYEGLELTIGAKLNSTLRGLTQSATESIRALAKNPLLVKGTEKILDTISTALQDIGNVWDSITASVVDAGGGIAVWEKVYSDAIDNIVSAVKFLWQNFVVGGPANLKLAFTLMIAGADRFKIMLVDVIRTATFLMLGKFGMWRADVVELFDLMGPQIKKVFVSMAGAIGGVFDNLKITIADAIDALINQVQQKVFKISRILFNLGFDDMAKDISDMGIAMGKFATAGDAARMQALENKKVRQAELKSIDDVIAAIQKDADEKRRIAKQVSDELIKETKAVSRQQIQASQIAVNLAILERDATIKQIEALREKRKEIIDGAKAGELIAGNGRLPIEDPIIEGMDAIRELGEVTESVFDSMADGIADFASQGKLDFKEFANSVIQDMIRIVARAKAMKFFEFIISKFPGGDDPTGGGTGGGGTTPVSMPGTGFAHGGEFQVGGGGTGQDSQLVQFMASPDETVSISKPGRGKRGGGDIYITFKQSIVADGADAQKFFAQVPTMLEQTRKAAVGDILKLKKQGVFERP